MSDEKTPKRPSGRLTKRLPPEELAIMVVHTERHGDTATAEKFGVSERTLQRWRKRIKDGKAPDLARLVDERKRLALAECSDLLTATYEQAIRRLSEVLPKASPHQVIGAVKILGELKIAHDVLTGEGNGELPGPDQQGSWAAANAISDRTRTPRVIDAPGSETPVH